MATAERVKRHPKLLEILATVLEGKPLPAVALAFELPEKELVAYCVEAGLLAGKPPAPDPEKELLEPEDVPSEEEALVDRAAVRERQLLEEGARRRGDPEGSKERFLEERDSGLKELLQAARAEEASYKAQPMPAIGARLANDPLGPAGFEFHVGVQPASRLQALVMRDQARREARRAEWFRDPFHWHQEPPPGWFD